jgi:tetratricopeptide (TPR) repeat protein
MTTSIRVLPRCAPHGLAYDPAIHDGCTLCRGSGRPRSQRAKLPEAWKTVALVVVMMLWVGGLLSAARWGYQRSVDRFKGATPARTALPPMPPPPAVGSVAVEADEKVPTELPMLGPAGVDGYGYPLDAVDKQGLRALLFAGQFPPLTEYLERLQTEFEADFRKEDWLTQAFESFADADPRVGQRIEEWLAANPSSFAPLVARAAHRDAVAWYYRGHAFAADTSKDRLEKYEAILANVESDTVLALAMRPKLVVAAQIELWALANHRKADAKRKVVDVATTACPECFRIRSKYLSSLLPRWGGSFSEMERYAVETQALSSRNPRLKVLLGYADDERATVYLADSKAAAALEACDRALATAKYHRFLATRAQTLRKLDRYPEALVSIDQALQQEPQNVDYLIDRADIRLHQGLLEDGTADLHLLRRLQHVSTNVSAAVDRGVTALVYAGYQRSLAGDDAGALAAYELALSLSPGNEDVQRRREYEKRRLTGSDVTVRLEAATRANPADFDAFKQLDDELVKTREFPRIVAHWNRYLAVKPDDARAYLERGGARLHASDIPGAIADLDRACAAGLPRGCEGARYARARTR